jgi:hypothetical protein
MNLPMSRGLSDTCFRPFPTGGVGVEGRSHRRVDVPWSPTSSALLVAVIARDPLRRGRQPGAT